MKRNIKLIMIELSQVKQITAYRGTVKIIQNHTGDGKVIQGTVLCMSRDNAK